MGRGDGAEQQLEELQLSADSLPEQASEEGLIRLLNYPDYAYELDEKIKRDYLRLLQKRVSENGEAYYVDQELARVLYPFTDWYQAKRVAEEQMNAAEIDPQINKEKLVDLIAGVPYDSAQDSYYKQLLAGAEPDQLQESELIKVAADEHMQWINENWPKAIAVFKDPYQYAPSQVLQAFDTFYAGIEPERGYVDMEDIEDDLQQLITHYAREQFQFENDLPEEWFTQKEYPFEGNTLAAIATVLGREEVEVLPFAEQLFASERFTR